MGHQILLAEQNAKASVRLVVKEATDKELKEARGNLAKATKKLATEQQKRTHQKMIEIKKLTDAKIKAERYKFKKMVDAAVKMAPAGEKSIRTKAKIALQKAKIAAKAYESQMRRSARPRTATGKRMSKKMAAACIQNPAGCKQFTLSSHNVSSAAKFAESRARKAKREQLKAKEGVAKAMEKLAVSTKTSQKYAQQASDLDEKETRIRLAKLQLNEAKAAAAFHSAAKAKLQSQVAHTKQALQRNTVQDKMKAFQSALKEMKVTSSATTNAQLDKAKQTRKDAFTQAQNAAKDILKMPNARAQ